MKRVIVCIVLSFLLLTPLFARADLIIVPENEFYLSHQDKIIYQERSFSANGNFGSVTVKDEPGAKSDITRIPNGTVILIQYICLYNGDYWGYTNEYSGWVEISQMLLIYDYISFEKEHIDEFYQYSGDFAEIKEAGSAITWPWPGAASPLSAIEVSNTGTLNLSYAYMDEEGREWGFMIYYLGNKNIWICLSDPLNDNIPPTVPAPEPVVWEPEMEYSNIEGETPADNSPITAAVIIVPSLLVCSALLIRIFWKPNKSGKK